MEYGLELYHHGVKGQHWGKHNGPPYPLYRKSAYYKKTGQRPPGYTGNKNGKGNSSSKGKIGKLPDDMNGYRKINSDDMHDVNFVKRYNKIKPRKEDAKTAAEVITNNTKGARNRILSTVPIMTSAAFLGKGLADRNKEARRLYLGGAALAGGIGLAQNIIGRRQQKKARNQATELTNKMIKQSKVKDIKAYDGELYVKDKRGRVGGYDDDDKRRSDLKRKILKGAGVAAGAAALAGAGYLAYRNRAAIGSKAGKLRDDIRFKLGEIPGTAKLNSARVAAKNRITSAINRAKSAPGRIKNELTNPTSAFRNDARLVGASAKGIARKAGNVAKSGALKVKATAAKPGQTVYNKIAGKSKSVLNVANIESKHARNNSRALKSFIDNNAQQIEKATIAKRKALAQIRRGEGNIKELNKAANNWAAKEKALIAKQNTAKALAPGAAADRISKAEAVRKAQEVFNKRNKLGRMAAGATNAGIGLGLAGAAGGAGYGISKLARFGKKKNQNRRLRRRR